LLEIQKANLGGDFLDRGYDIRWTNQTGV